MHGQRTSPLLRTRLRLGTVVGLVTFAADSAECRDSPGGKVASALSFVTSTVTGEALDADDEKIDL